MTTAKAYEALRAHETTCNLCKHRGDEGYDDYLCGVHNRLVNAMINAPIPGEAEIIDAVSRCIVWCCPEQPEIVASTVRHNWRRFLGKP